MDVPYYRHYVRLVVTAVTVFTATVHGRQSYRYDLQNTTTRDQPGNDDVINTTWPPTSVHIELFPVDELRATVSDRKQISVHVTVEVAPPRSRTTDYDNSTVNGHSLIL